MPRVRVIHWRAAEAVALIEACRGAGFDVEYLEGDGGAICRAIRANSPDVVVIDLTRLPSHGKEVAVWLRGAKSTRDIPIVFVDGDPLKVAAVRELLPDAVFCAAGKVAAAIKRAAPRKNPVAPPGMMERAREKSAAHKLGITARSAVACIEPPRDFPELLGELPDSVDFREDDAAPITLWFVHDRQRLLENLRRMRTMASRTRLWLLWRKGANGSSSAGVTQNSVREMAREVGLVDYKICSVDQHWSAMLFARKKV
jgi:CheY-like chemotaxis protein